MQEDEEGNTRYNAASPDEKALVEGAERYDCRFVERRPESVTVTTCRGTRETYQVLNVIEFTSTRKRMSIIVRTPEGEIRVFTKGADRSVKLILTPRWCKSIPTGALHCRLLTVDCVISHFLTLPAQCNS